MRTYRFLILAVIMLFPAAINSGQTNLDPEFTSKFFIKAMDYGSPQIRNAADEIIKKYPGNNISQICETFDLVYLHWKYKEHNGNGEPYVRASKSILTFTGDCKDYASLMVSMFVALGGDGRLVTATNHIYPEVYIGKHMSQASLDSVVIMINKYYEAKSGYKKFMSMIHYHVDSDGAVWMNMDWQSYYPGSKFIEDKSGDKNLVIYSTGKYKEEELQELSLSF